MKKNCNCEKIDKGFELDYWKLSYRRKFIRTLWLIPLGIIAVMLVWVQSKSFLITSISAAVIIGTEIAQVIYTYKKWKDIDKGVTAECE